MTDQEVDDLFRKCHEQNQENLREPKLGIFIPFDISQVDLIKNKLQTWLDPQYCPCRVLNHTRREIETDSTDLIFFFIGDGNDHPQLYPSLLQSLSQKTQNTSINQITTVMPCFNAVVFRSLRDLNIPTSSTLSDLFYGVFKSNLLDKYTHMIWMDVSVSALKRNWLPALFHQLYSEPFWVLGAMTSSKRNDHFDRSHYHMHMNAIYRLGDKCFSSFLKRVRKEFQDVTPDVAMHQYRTDFANFREAQHTQHLFRYSRLFIALDVPLEARPNAKSEDWPGAYFLIQDRHWSRFGKNMPPIISETDVQHINQDRKIEEDIKKAKEDDEEVPDDKKKDVNDDNNVKPPVNIDDEAAKPPPPKDDQDEENVKKPDAPIAKPPPQDGDDVAP